MLKVKALSREFYAAILFCFISLTAFAQRPYGNEWINFSQQYFKIKVAKDGIFRVDQTALISAGMSATADPKQIQLFYRGSQVPVFIAGESDGVLDAGDYVEFRGQRNDGVFDALLYAKPGDITHTDYSNCTDTSAYFLTISSQGPYLRFQEHTTTSGAGAIGSVIGSKAKYFRKIYQGGLPIIYDDAARAIPEYNAGEGWTDNLINTTNVKIPKQKIDTFFLEDALAGSTFEPVLEVKVVSQNMSKVNNPDHRLLVDISSDAVSQHTVIDTSYDAYQVIHKKETLTLADLQGKTIVTVTPVNSPGFLSTIAVAFEKITYEKELNAQSHLNTEFEYGPVTGSSTVTFGFKVPAGFGTPALVLYGLSNGHRSHSYYENAMVYFTLPAPGISSRFLLTRKDDYATAPIIPASLRNINVAEGYNFLLVTHSKLLNAAQQYANYKATRKIDDKESFKPVVVTVNELYDVFSYGVKHPIAIQNFSAYMYKKSPAPPQYLFLFGKGITINSVRSKPDLDLVPTLGMPASDLLYTAGIDRGFTGFDTSLNPLMGVGRLPAKTEAEALAYLQKMKDYDASPSELWHKDAIHVGGGVDEDVQLMAESILKRTEKIFEDKDIGGNVYTFLAKSSNTIEIGLRAAIQGRIEKGAGLLTYYGHAAGTLLGVEIAKFSTLNNKGKYPIMYLNGCSVGDPSIFGSPTIAEDYLVRPDTGGIAWISHSNTALSNNLETQMIRFYRNMSEDSLYGSSIGKIWAKSISDIKVGYNVYDMGRQALFAWTIQGDPSVRFHFKPLPDYAIYENEISISPKDVIASADVFYLNIPISNLGRASDATPSISVKQKLPNGEVITHADEYPLQGIYYKDTFQFAIHRQGNSIQGENRFLIDINQDRSIEEMDYTNNRIDWGFYIQGTGARSLFPADYAISGTDTITLVAQSRDLFDTTAEAFFELDTVHTFSSPYKKVSGLVKGSNIATWKVNLLLTDSTVYYWRSRLNLPLDSGGEWDTRSFTYIKGSSPGWSQSRWPQFKGITGTDIKIDTTRRVFGYNEIFAQIGVRMTVFGSPSHGIFKEGENMTICWFGATYLAMAEFDGITLQPLTSTYVSQCNRNVLYSMFNMNEPADRQNFVKAIDKVKVGNYVAVTTRYNRQSYKDWEPEVIAAFKKIGSQTIQDIKRDSTSFVIVGRKGELTGTLLDEDDQYDPDPALKAGDTARIEVKLRGRANSSGALVSEKIGPADSWKSVHHNWSNLEAGSKDNVYLQVLGENDSTLTPDTLIARIDSSSADLSGIDAKKYKYIYLRAVVTDTVNFTPPQLKNWTVLFGPVPEGTLVIDNKFVFNKDTVAQGETVNVKIRYQNISPYRMKEMLVRTSINDINGNPIGSVKEKYYKALAPGEYFYVEDTLRVSVDISGENMLSIYVNPEMAQPELNLENNFLKIPFYVPSGEYNPLMDVTFDGRHLRSGEIVSANPVIEVNAWGAATGMPLYDSAFFQLTLTGPDNLNPVRIGLVSPQIEFKAGTFDDNHASIIFKPQLESGTYTFTAQVMDIKGQKSGMRPYSITFKVVSESKASRIYMYPNPLTGTSKFVYTLTGNTKPEVLLIQIFNLRGQRVHEISLDRLEESHIGYNEVEWDGNGANGSILPNGIYLYRVISRLNGQDAPIYGVPEDKDLEKTYGKIIILRD